MISLTYVSSAVRVFEEKELLDLLRTARKNNERLGITGMLLYKDGGFMQTLEGTDESVTSLINVIAADPRHRGILQLLKKEVPERSFGDWSMAFQNLDTMTPEDLKTFSPFLSGSLLDDSFRQHPEKCYKLMLNFKKITR